MSFTASAAETGGVTGTRPVVALSPSDGTGKAAPPVASAVHLDNSADRAMLRFSLTNAVAAQSFVLAAPDRVVLDLPEVDFRIPPQAGLADRPHGKSAGGLVHSFRFGLFAAGRSRIVINLTGPAKIERVATESDGKGQVLVIALAKTSAAEFQSAARKAVLTEAKEAPPSDAPPPATTGPASNLPVVVVDPGHGGVDSGAMFNGLVEKNIVLGFAKMLAEKLEATGRYKVVMTRDRDIFIPLGGRVRIARDAHAALFVSIHADTIPDARAVSGATVYTNSDRASDAEAARTAEKENQSDATAGVDEKGEPAGVSDILFDLTKRETRAYSHVFARTLVNYWRVVARLNKNPERAAGFIVLTAPDVPSVLLELGYLSNVRDEKSLVSPGWRDETTNRIVAAINAFFDRRGRRASANPASLPATAASLDAPAITGTIPGGKDPIRAK